MREAYLSAFNKARDKDNLFIRDLGGFLEDVIEGAEKQGTKDLSIHGQNLLKTLAALGPRAQKLINQNQQQEPEGVEK